MAIGDLIFQLMGKPDPRDQILASIGQQVQPQAQPQQQAAEAKPEPEAYKSPDDLMTLYGELMKRQERNAMISGGLGLLASSFAQPQNKAAIMQVAGAGAGGDFKFDPISAMESIQKIQAGRTAAELAAQERASLPALAEQLGIPVEQATVLQNAGQLDEFISEMKKPNRINFETGDGRQMVVDATTGKTIGTFGEPKPVERKTQVVNNPDGSSNLIDSQTGEVIQQVVKPGNKPTDPMIEWMRINAEREAAGKETIPLEEWLLEKEKAGAQQTIIGAGETQAAKTAGELGAKKAYEKLEKLEGGLKTIENAKSSRAILDEGIVAGSMLSPYEKEGRKIFADLFNIPDDETQNTDVFIATAKENVLSRVKELGTGNSISNADRDFINQAFGGDITLSTESLRRISQKLERGSVIDAIKRKKEIIRWNEKHEGSEIDIPEIPALSPDAMDEANAAMAEKLGKGASKQDVDAITDALQKDPSPANRKKFDQWFGATGMADLIIGDY